MVTTEQWSARPTAPTTIASIPRCGSAIRSCPTQQNGLLARLLCVAADVDAPTSRAKPAEAAWEAVYERIRPSLVRALTAATGSYDGVEDAIHDAFGEALQRSPSELANVEG